MTVKQEMQHGDFSGLAENYSKYRPGYSKKILDVMLRLLDKENRDIDFVDVGAGTGIWSRMVTECGCKTTAVEPNDQMRKFGIEDSKGLNIEWKEGNAEETGLEDSSRDLLTMASSFHWPDFDKAVKEFARILRPEGWFCALWNPRLLEVNPLLVEIENKLKELVPDLKRVSSGRGEFCNTLTDRLEKCGFFKDVFYMEARHIECMSKERYIGVWKSVNDIRVQAGEERFGQFIDYIDGKISDGDSIDATYQTRVWAAKVKK